jgi:hypothetical protein
MENRIRETVVTDHRLDPAESEVRIAVYPERLTPTTEVRGRLTGPRSAYASTVEIAYRVQEVARAADHILARVVIPEPCFWEPQSPFLYEGPLELWQDGQRCDQTPVSHGLRSVRFTAQDLRLNGRPVVLRGTTRKPASEEEARALRAAGYDLVFLLDSRTDYPEVWARADRFGLFVLARPFAPSIYLRWKHESHFHAGALAWVFTPPYLEGETILTAFPSRSEDLIKRVIGVEVENDIPHLSGAEPSFLLCDEKLLPAVAGVELPKFVLVDALPAQRTPAPPGVVGWIERGAG